MIAEAGHYALVLALALALIQASLPIWGVLKSDVTLMGVAPLTACAQCAFTAIAFGALAWSYATSDFSLLNVAQNSHSAQPLIYKLTGVWGNHEGSMLLWVFILTIFGALVGLFGRNLPEDLRAAVLGVQGAVAAAFFLFILATSNPFLRLSPAPFDGRDLNPILQDPGLAIHPPLLYVGYVGFSIAYAFAVAALITGRIDAAWARWVRPWTLLAWIFLTLGIAMGSYWAYYELGWGGWWFWDPVENASFMPWLAGTALLHSAIVMEKRDALKVWTLLLAILTFSLSLLGTFLVRSGVLTSVHAFAVDPARGVAILLILCVFIGGALALYALRAPVLKIGGLFAPISREGALLLNNLFLTAATAAVFVGTLYPLALEALTGAKISVGPPFFNLTFGPLMLPVLIALPFGPFLAWKRGDLLGAAQRLVAAMAIAALAVLAMAFLRTGAPVLAVLGIGLATFLILGALSELASRIRLFELTPSSSLNRLIGLPRSAVGTTLGHMGIGLTLLGIVSATAFESEAITVMRPGDTVTLAGHAITFEGATPRHGPNYTEMVGRFAVAHDSGVAHVESAKRVFTASGRPTTEVGLLTEGVSQVYVSMGDTTDSGTAMRLYVKPLVLLIWLGFVVAALGGLVSLSDRRLRIGAPVKAKRLATPQPAE